MTISQTINGRLRHVPAWVAYVIGSLPMAWLIWALFTGGLGVDPVKGLEFQFGLWGMKFIIASLCVTPIRRLTGVNLIKYRRAIGLWSFFYVVLHILVWMLLDLQLEWGPIGSALLLPYIIVGVVGTVLMVPLAVTSNNLSVRRMGAAAWGRLHRLAYPAAVLGALHYLLAVKAFPRQAVTYLAIVLVLLALRVVWARRRLIARLA